MITLATVESAELFTKIIARSGTICPTTTFGWLWYCDTHDTHGNADSEAEARAIARAHRKFMARIEEIPEREACDLFVRQALTEAVAS